MVQATNLNRFIMNKLSSKVIYIYSPLFVILYNLAGNLANDIYLPTLPVIGEEFHVSNFYVQFSITIWFLGVAIPQIYFGLIADRFGSRPLMLWGGVLFLLSTVCCLQSTSIYMLLSGRFLQGVAVSSLNIATFATVRSQHYQQAATLKFITCIHIVGSMAPLLGPILGSYLYAVFGWRSTFLFVLILGFLALAGLYFFLIESSDRKNHEIRWGLSSSLNYYKEILSNKRLIIATGIYTSLLAALIAYLTTAPLVVSEQFYIPSEYFGLTQTLPSISFILGGLVVNRMVNKYSLNTIIQIGLVIVAVSSLQLLVVSLIHSLCSVFSYLLAISCFLFGFAFVGSPLMSEALSSSPHKGGAAAILGVAMAIMASLGSFATAIFYHGHIRVITIIITVFVSLGIISYQTGKGVFHHDKQ
ncbi:transporter of the major facilitator superfamily (MFS) [Legionella jordanis]|uniref:Transporter of the major facilitator superfamily (MFS) n=2 Tax=Legionella jordanis TaxID=456 RepID=A0A0W0VGU7_9GAMM|nr:transporter of the major facilitator superfamily (MFS) [Legionella jordanis]VEH12933.1 transporter of the major facilitator superfamily (MFS) [Legionella jordanis]